MTKQEFDCIVEGARLTRDEDYDALFELVEAVLNNARLLDDYDGDTYEK